MLARVTGKGAAVMGAAQWGMGAIAGLAARYNAAAGALNCCCCGCCEPQDAKVARTKAVGAPWLARLRLGGFIPKFVGL